MTRNRLQIVAGMLAFIAVSLAFRLVPWWALSFLGEKSPVRHPRVCARHPRRTAPVRHDRGTALLRHPAGHARQDGVTPSQDSRAVYDHRVVFSPWLTFAADGPDAAHPPRTIAALDAVASDRAR